MKVLQVGLGSMGKRRIQNLRVLGVTEFLGFDTRDDRRAELMALGIPTTDSFAAGLAWGPDVVVISTPPDLHYEYCRAAAEAGRPWFCEANILSVGARELGALAAQHGVVGAPSCTMRFHPVYQRLHQFVKEERKAGQPLFFTFHLGQYLLDWHPWEGLDFYGGRKETGAAREMVPFEFDWMVWVFGRVVEVQATYGPLMGLPGGVDDLYAILVRFESGVTASVVIDVIARTVLRQGRLLSQSGVLDWDVIAQRLAWTSGETKSSTDLVALGGAYDQEQMYVAEMGQFLAACRGESPWPHTYADDLHLEEILLAAERSSRYGIRVRIPAPGA